MAPGENSNGFGKSPSGQHEKPLPMGIDLRSSTTPTQEELLAYGSWKAVKAKAGEMLTVFIRTWVAELSLYK